MRTFWVLVKKELKELLTLQVIVPFLVVILIFAGLGGVISSAGEDAVNARLIVIDADRTARSAVVVDALEASGLQLTVVEEGDLDSVVAARAAEDVGLFVEIPAGFGAAFDRSQQGTLGVRTVMRDFSMLGTLGEAQLQGALAAAGQSIAAQVAAERAPDVPAVLLQQPLAIDESVTIGTHTAETSVGAVSAFIGQQTVLIPIVLFIVIVFAAQLIAAGIATEKENKTLETLLSYPISRTSLVTAKMLAAGLVSLGAAGAYMAGMQRYMSGINAGFGAGDAAGGSQAIMESLGLTFAPSDYVLLGLSLFAGILLALAIAIILGAFAESVKAVGALITPLMVLLMVPYLLTMFVNLDAASPAFRWGVMAIPFTHPFTAAQNLFLGNEGAVWAGIGYQLVWFAAFAFIAARIFSSDRILTMKLDLRRKKSRLPAAP